MEPDSSTEDPPSPQKAESQKPAYLESETQFSQEERVQQIIYKKPIPTTTTKMPSPEESIPPALKKKHFSNSFLEQFGDLVKEEGGVHQNLPLSVEINEMEADNESVSPPRARPFPLPSPSNPLSPRKRGRKPKHYSEILFELGQRGISITKTQKEADQTRANHKVGSMFQASGDHCFFQTGGQQLKCPHCNKILTTSVGLMYHIRLHTGLLKKTRFEKNILFRRKAILV